MRCGACHDLNSAAIGMMRRDASCLGLAENFLEVLILKGHFHVRVGLRTLNTEVNTAVRVEVCRVAGWTNSISRQGSVDKVASRSGVHQQRKTRGTF